MGRLFRLQPRATSYSPLNAPSTVVYNPNPGGFLFTPPEVFLDSAYGDLTWEHDELLTDQGNATDNATLLQGRIDDAAARVGHTRLRLPDGFVSAAITLKAHTAGDFWTYIEWENIDSVQAEGVQANPNTVATTHADAPEIQSGAGAVTGAVLCENGVNFTRLVGLRFTAPTAVVHHRLVYFHPIVGTNEDQADSLGKLPQWVGLDRCWVDGGNISRVKNGVIMDTREGFIVNSVINGCYLTGSESHGVNTITGPGPHKYEGNAVEGGSINYLLGGADPQILGMQTTDVVWRRNYIYKRPSWNKNDSGNWDGISKTCKNLFELKWGARILVEANVFDGNYHDGGQAGASIVWKVENSNGTNDTIETHDVTFRHNIIRNSSGYAEFQGRGDPIGGELVDIPLYRVQHYNNLVYNLHADLLAEGAENGRSYFITNEANSITVDHETVVIDQDRSTDTFTKVMAFAGTNPDDNFVFKNNVVACRLTDELVNEPNNLRTILGDGETPVSPDTGSNTLEVFASGYDFTDNVVVRGQGGTGYPAESNWPTTNEAVGFVDLPNGDYRIDPSSDFAGICADGSDPGADIDLIEFATAGVAP